MVNQVARIVLTLGSRPRASIQFFLHDHPIFKKSQTFFRRSGGSGDHPLINGLAAIVRPYTISVFGQHLDSIPRAFHELRVPVCLEKKVW
jgi:hypothetical protein